MKKHLGIGCAALVLAAAVSGCGGSPGTTTATDPPTSAAVSPGAAAAVGLKTASSSAGTIVVEPMA